MTGVEPAAFRAALIDEVGDAVIVIERDGRLRFANRATTRLFGWDATDWVGRNVFELVHQDDRGRVAAVLVSSGSAGVVDPVALRILTADGGTRWVEAVANSRLEDPDVQGVVVSLRDLTDRLVERAALDEAEERFRLAFEHAPIGMALVAPDGRWLRVNAALCDLVGYGEEELLGGTFQEITHPDDLESDLGLVSKMLAGEISSYTLEKRYLRSDGQQVWAVLSVSLARDEAGEPRYFISQVQDVDERKRAEQDLRRASRLDPLTGIANRRAFEERLSEAMEAPRVPAAGLLFVDVDHLKLVNDHHGHSVGDELLRVIAQRLGAAVGTAGTVARWGGDELIALLDDVASAHPAGAAMGAAEAGEALQCWVECVARAMEQPVSVGPVEIMPTVSIGASLLGGEVVSASALIARADEEMYRAKRARRA